MTQKEQIIQSIVKLNLSAKPSWLDQFSHKELCEYYERLLSTYINCPPVRTASTKPEPTGEYIF